MLRWGKDAGASFSLRKNTAAHCLQIRIDFVSLLWYNAFARKENAVETYDDLKGDKEKQPTTLVSGGCFFGV